MLPQKKQLSDLSQQYWALGLGMLAMPLVTYGLHVPMSCVEHPDAEALKPSQCAGFDGHGLRLPDFCWRPCEMHHRKFHMLCSLTVGLLLQAIVVILSHGGCQNWLHISWYLDPSGLVEKLDREDTEQGMAAAWSMTGFMRRRAMRQAKGALSSLTRNSVQNLFSARAASTGSSLCLLITALRLGLIVFVDYSQCSVFFECLAENGDTVFSEHKPTKKFYLMAFLTTSLAFMIIATILQNKAEWTVRVTVTPKNAAELKEQLVMRADPSGVTVYYAPTGHGQEEKDAELQARYSDLQAVSLMRLVKVKYEGIYYSPEKAIGRVPRQAEEDDKTVILHFRKFRGKKSLDMENEHRKYAVFTLSVAAILMFTASMSCWTCLKGIRIEEQHDISAMQLDKWLMLMGACGRHADIGQRCLIGTFLLGVAVVMQIAIMFCSEQRLHGEHAYVETRDHKQQLYLPLMDSRRHNVLNAAKYVEAGAEMPEVKCYVWVAQLGGNKEIAMDCPTAAQFEGKEEGKGLRHLPVASGERALTSPRNQAAEKQPPRSEWRKSSKAKKVSLLLERSETRKSWAEGLPRLEYNVPSICIDFTEGGKVVKQIVPPEFVAGHFHAWLNLGPKLAWEKLSAALGLCAALLGAYDILVYELAPGGKILSSCQDVLNSGRCLVVGLNHLSTDTGPLVFRHSVGVFVASAGSLFAMLGVMGLRVASQDRPTPCPWSGGDGRCRTLCSCVGAYLCALLYSVQVAFQAVGWVCHHCCNCVRCAIVRWCYPLEDQPEVKASPGGVVAASSSDA